MPLGPGAKDYPDVFGDATLDEVKDAVDAGDLPADEARQIEQDRPGGPRKGAKAFLEEGEG